MFTVCYKFYVTLCWNGSWLEMFFLHQIVDVETRQDLPAKEVGEILCKGPQMTMGYLNNSAATKDLYTSDNYLKTGWVNQLTTILPQEQTTKIQNRIAAV